MMLFAALLSLGLAPVLHEAAERGARRGGWAVGGMQALDTWMAVVASGVVLLEVMPESVEHLGVYAIAVALLGAVLTNAAHHGGGDRWVGVAALLGLSAHSLLDGAAIATAGATSVGLAVTLHNAPAGVAIWRAAGKHAPRALAVAGLSTLAGATIAHLGFASTSTLSALTPMLSALQCFVAGSVLHIVTHVHPRVDSNGAAPPPNTAGWTAAGGLVGTLTVGAIVFQHPVETPISSELSVWPTALALWMEGAPYLFVGLVAVGALAHWRRLSGPEANALLGIFAAAAWLGALTTLIQLTTLIPLLNHRSATPMGAPRTPASVVAQTAPWLLAGLLAASLAEPWMAQDLGQIPLAVQLLSAALLHLVLASPLALAPLAAVLVHKGADPAVAIALTMPPLLSLAMANVVPARGLKAASVLIAMGIAWVLPMQSLVVSLSLDLHALAEHPRGVIEYTAGAVVAGMYLAALLRGGLGGLVSALEHGPE